jgi:hypothetical protein
VSDAERLPPDRHEKVDHWLTILRAGARSHTLTVRYEVKKGRLCRVKIDPPPDEQEIVDRATGGGVP